MRIKEIMTSPVITMSEDASLREAVAILSSAKISGAPVVDAQGVLVGIISEHDIIQALMPKYEDMLLSEPSMLNVGAMETRAALVRDNPVGNFMTRNVATVEEDDSVLDAASMIILRRIKSLPVVREGKPVGIVARIDIVAAVMSGKL